MRTTKADRFLFLFFILASLGGYWGFQLSLNGFTKRLNAIESKLDMLKIKTYERWLKDW